MIKAGIVGGTGYAAGELLRILLNHPETEIQFIFSTSKAGEPVASVHRDLLGETDLHFSHELDSDIDVLFLCMGHGNSVEFLDSHPVDDSTRIIDLSRDFRLAPDQTYNDRRFTYGLPELQKEAVKNADNVANPGCFATAIQLALYPLANSSNLNEDVHIHGITGSTGAGSSMRETTHFSWRDSNVSIYKPLRHQHIGEVRQKIEQLDPNFDRELNFIPVRGDFTRGIFISAYTQSDLSAEQARELFKDYYQDSPFVHLSDEPIHLKQAVNTNKDLLHVAKEDGKLLITSIIDNLLKGASGQAVQNMNLMFDLDESAGLYLKPSHF
ncbi:N-acetyl-gamma-glutamyl-phosphate reductase [Fodinibius salsisoli]|uniref:N-acetyl-gamma-glutamyl-phosphate reductase n=1 Tax=Fodinibius salsisoli TaxID=2820877 RepID=A0ABT3PSQ8_9BACT|nr:N-acetyl-gamma-glutamyl-phosphate reductase [Fodinibius salsisoli]MCW9708890.1 N-acetyl-gamma-glutamyl-phosphate reductase [Fodinibius salsisoli]